MSNIVLKKNNTKAIRLIAGLAAIIAVIVCGFKIATAIQHNAITVKGTNGDITVNSNQINGLNITPAVVFNKTGSSITYQFTLQSPEKNAFQIKGITDDNTNQYVKTSYQYSNEKNSADKPVLITLSYDKYLPFGDNLNLKDIHIAIDIDEGESKADEKEDSGSKQQEITPSGSTNAPNTGAGNTDATKYFKSFTEVNNQAILPNAIICIISIAVIITVVPSSRHRRMQFGKISVMALCLTFGGILSINTHAKSTKLELTIFGSNISAMPDSSNPQEVVSVTFPNIYNGNQNIYQQRVDYAASHEKAQAPGNNIILKTLDNKYVMMDTGPNFSSIRDNIYSELKKSQGTNTVKLDYLILSHLDGDHIGNVKAILADTNFDIKNIVFKTEVYPEQTVTTWIDDVITTAKTKNINVITAGGQDAVNYLKTINATGYQMLTEGQSIQVGKYLKLDFFNTSNVYSGKSCQYAGYSIAWTANINAANLYKTANGEYVYFDGSEYKTSENNAFSLRSVKFPYADVELKTTTTPTTKPGGSGINRYFYATNSALNETSQTHNLCARNPNSFGILAEITTAGLNKYMYFSGDIENAGYGTLSSGANSGQIFDEVVFQNGDFQASEFQYSIPSEDDTARAIRNKLIADAKKSGLPDETLLNNIVLYQMSHHGINNSEKAVWALNLNRSSGVYAIEEGASSLPNNNTWRFTKAYNYTLGNLPAENKLRVGNSTVSNGTVTKPIAGVDCSVNTNGTTTCAHY